MPCGSSLERFLPGNAAKGYIARIGITPDGDPYQIAVDGKFSHDAAVAPIEWHFTAADLVSCDDKERQTEGGLLLCDLKSVLEIAIQEGKIMPHTNIPGKRKFSVLV